MTTPNVIPPEPFDLCDLRDWIPELRKKAEPFPKFDGTQEEVWTTFLAVYERRKRDEK